MKPPLKLSAIEQEHLQELYDAAGVARDELPYTAAFENLIQEFQDRAFKNADGEQVFGAILKYGRTGAFSNKNEGPPSTFTDEQIKQLKQALMRHATGGKVLPYSDAFTAAKNEFAKASGQQLNDQQFWQSVMKALGSKRRPPPPRKKAVKVSEDDEE